MQKQKICEKLEADLALLLKKTETKSVQNQYVNSSKLLDKIINEQRDPSNKTGLGYSLGAGQKKMKTYADALCNTFVKEEKKTNVDLNSRRSLLSKEDETKPSTEQNSRMRSPLVKKAYQPRNDYQNKPPHIFLGYFYACSNFGHKAINCRAYKKKKLTTRNYKNTPVQTRDINYNPFSPLQRSPYCFIRHNF